MYSVDSQDQTLEQIQALFGETGSIKPETMEKIIKIMFCEACYHLVVLTGAAPGSELAHRAHSTESEFRVMDDLSAKRNGIIYIYKIRHFRFNSRTV